MIMSEITKELDNEEYKLARDYVVVSQRCSISGIQRALKIGFNRAVRLVQRLENDGVVSAPGHDGLRTVLTNT